MADQQAPQALGGNLQTVQAVNLGGALAVPAGRTEPVLSPFPGGTNTSVTNNTTILSGGAGTFANVAAFPSAVANQGAFAIAQDTNTLYCANNGQWFAIAVLA